MEKLSSVLFKIKTAWDLTSLIIFILSGIFLLTVDLADLKTKGLEKELRTSRIFGVIYIFGSLIIFTIFKYFI